MIELAVQLIEQKTSAFKPVAYRDHFQDALKTLVQEKLRGHKIVTLEDATRPTGANVIDLMEALKRSVGQPAARAPTKTAAARARPAAKMTRKSPAKRRKTST